jgi:hypothetical protein
MTKSTPRNRTALVKQSLRCYYTEEATNNNIACSQPYHPQCPLWLDFALEFSFDFIFAYKNQCIYGPPIVYGTY